MRLARSGLTRRTCTGAWLAFALALFGFGSPLCAQETPSEPPPEAADGDYAFERADSVADRSFETSFGARGNGGAPKQNHAVRFRGDGAEGSFRDGEDALAGSRYRASVAAGTLAWGRLSPRWGCGLLLGAASDPWKSLAVDRGSGARFRGRAGEGAAFAHDGALGFDAVAGRFTKRALAGVRLAAHGVSLGVLAGARAELPPGAPTDAGAAASLAAGGDGAAGELACDARGRWRAEIAWSAARSTTPSTAPSTARSAEEPSAGPRLRARAGHVAYRSLAEGARSGAARLIAAGDAWDLGATSVRIDAALWSFGTGADGSRAALEVRRALGQHAATSLGCEEQHGQRRAPPEGTRLHPIGMRQGCWLECSTVARGRIFRIRHELWGAHAFARSEVRRLIAASIEMPLSAGARLTVLHAVWRASRSERLYLPEDEVDRVTLRAVSGAGARTRLQAALPLLGGRVRAALVWTDPSPPRATPGWSVEWTRRVRR